MLLLSFFFVDTQGPWSEQTATALQQAVQAKGHAVPQKRDPQVCAKNQDSQVLDWDQFLGDARPSCVRI